MRINKPQLFNGQYLASRDEIFGLLGLGFNSSASGVVLSGDALISSSLIPWTEIAPSTIISKVNGSNLLISAGSDQTIIDYVGAVSGNLSNAIESAITGAAADASAVAANLKIVSGNLNTVSGNLATVSGDLSKIKLVKNDAAEEGFAATYTFTNAAGATTEINIPKDQFLKDASYIPSAEVLRFTFELTNVDGTWNDEDKVVDIPVGDLVDEYSAGNGIDITDVINGKNVISVKLANGNESFLTVDENGLKLDGVQDAIDTASGAAYTTALADAKAYSDLVSGAAAAQFTAEAAARSAADNFLSGSIDYVSGQVAGVAGYEVFGGALSGDISAEADKLAKVGAVKDYVNAEVSKAVAGDVTDLLNGKVDKDQIASGVVAGDSLPTNNAVITYVTGYVAGHNAVYTTENFAEPADKTLTGLYVSAEGETRFWNGTDFIATSEQVADEFAGAESDAIPTVKAVEDYVSGQVAATVATVNTKAVEMREAPVEFGLSGETKVSGFVSGRVVAVYDELNEQCYPTITYANGVSTIYADAEVSGYTVIYAKRIGQEKGELPEYTNA